MRKIPVLTGLLLSLAWGQPVAAAPLEGNIGVVFKGVDADLGITGTPVRFGGQIWQGIYAVGLAQTGWAGITLHDTAENQLMLMAGGTHYQQGGFGCLDVCPPMAEYGVLAGFSYLIRAERLWFRVQPHYYLALGGGSAYPTLGLSGLPWAEVGIPITSQWEVSIRVCETFLKVAYKL